MAINEELQDRVLTEMAKYLIKNDPGFRFMSDGEEEVGKSIIQGMGKLQVDETPKVRFAYSRMFGYGYDFEKSPDAKETYENAVRRTKQFSEHPNFETFLDSGVEENMGWYLTTLA